MSQKEFFQQSMGVGKHLQEAGVVEGDVIVIAAPDPKTILSAFLGSVCCGAQPVIVSTRPAFETKEVTKKRLTEIADSFDKKPYLVLDPNSHPEVDGLEKNFTIIFHPGVTRKSTLAAIRHNPKSICFYQLTSGTTGTPKPIAVSHQNLLENLIFSANEGKYTPDEKILSWLPLNHDLGLVGMALNAIVNGLDLLLMTPFDFISKPTNWIHLISETKSTITASPNFGLELIRKNAKKLKHSENIDLSNWKMHYLGAEMINLRLVNDVTEILEPFGFSETTIRASYGMAEATIAVCIGSLNTPIKGVHVHQTSYEIGQKVTVSDLVDYSQSTAKTIASVGKAIPGVTIQLIDAEGSLIEEENTCGEVAISGSSVTLGYLDKEGTIDGWENNLLPSGDIGFFHNGELYLVDRLKNILIQRGVNYSVAALENELANTVGLSSSSVALVEDSTTGSEPSVVVIAENPKGRQPEELLEKIQHVVASFDLEVDRIVIAARGNIPLTTSGKKQHKKAGSMLKNNTIKTLLDTRSDTPTVVDIRATASNSANTADCSTQIKSLLKQFCAKRELPNEFTEESSLKENLGLDSLNVIELASEIEQKFAVEVPETSLGELFTVKDVIDLVDKLLASSDAFETSLLERMSADLLDLPQTMLKIDSQNGRELTAQGKKIYDFASCNYLGFDLHPQIIDSVGPALQTWGVHPSWTRAVASPALYDDLEKGLAELIGAPDVLVFPTLTLQHVGILPIIAKNGTIFIDQETHNSVQEAADFCSTQGIKVVSFSRKNLDDLTEKLKADTSKNKVLAVDGVYSISGQYADLPTLVSLAEEFDAQIYVDDAHGFGIIGENPTDQNPWGLKGNGLVKYYGLNYDRIIYAGGLSKAYSTMAAFVSVRNQQERYNYSLASTSIFSGPIPVASLASGIAAIEVNATEGDLARDRLRKLTKRLIDGVRALGYTAENDTGFPIITVIIGDLGLFRAAAEQLWAHGLLFTPSVFPAAPIDKNGVRFTMTATNTSAQVDRILTALKELKENQISNTAESTKA